MRGVKASDQISILRGGVVSEQRKFLIPSLQVGLKNFHNHKRHSEFNVYVSRCCFGVIRPQDNWEIVRGLREGSGHIPQPPKHEGEVLKKRRWPLKGWNTVRANTRGVLKKAHSVLRGESWTSVPAKRSADTHRSSLNLIECACSVDHPVRSHVSPGSRLSRKAFTEMMLPR